MRKKGLTQWQYNKLKVFFERMVEKYHCLADEILQEATEYFKSEGMDINDLKKKSMP